LITTLTKSQLGGLPREDAEITRRSLEEAQQAHLIDGNWVFRHPVEPPQLLHLLDREEPRSEATEFIASKLGLGEDVAREVLEDLEAAGYAPLGYDADYQRSRVLSQRP
jgi:hypothetical protein